MGGRITRALYKNQRQTSHRSNSRFGAEMRQLSVSFTLVMSSIASFLIGYLHRPYSLHSTVDPPRTNTLNPLSSQTLQPSPTDWQSFSLSFVTIIIVLFAYLLRKQHPNQSSLQHILRLTRISATVSGLLFVFDILSWALSYDFKWIFTTAYGLLWISFINICLLVFNNIKFVQHRKECKERQNNEQQNVSLVDLINTKRSLFLTLSVLLFECGTKCSDYMRQLRVEKMVREVVEGKQLQKIMESDGIYRLQSLPSQYQTFILESQHFEKLMLRVVFLFLVVMIGTTVVAFEKKSLFQFYLFQVRKNEYMNWYEREIEVKQHALDNRKPKSKEYNNLSKKSIIMSTMLFMVGFLLIESQVQRVRYFTKESSGYQNQVSFKSGGFFAVFTLGVSFLMLKGMMLAKSYLTSRWLSSSGAVQRESKMKGLETGVLWLIFIGLLVLGVLGGNVFEINPQQNQKEKVLHQEMTFYYLPLSMMMMTEILLIFSYVRLINEQLWRFPQTGFQPFIVLAVAGTFMSRFLLPYQLLGLVSHYLINCTVLPVVRVLKSVIHLFVAGRGAGQPNTEHMLCTLILVFIIMMVLIGLNSQRTIQQVIDLTDDKLRTHNHSDQQEKLKGNRQYEDEDTKPKLTSNLIVQQPLEQVEEASKLLE